MCSSAKLGHMLPDFVSYTILGGQAKTPNLTPFTGFVVSIQVFQRPIQ